MKKILFSILLLAGITATAQVKVGTNPTSIDNSAMLQIDTTTKGFLPPRMTTGERDLIASPAKGLVIYNTILDCFQINKGTAALPIWDCIAEPDTDGDGIKDTDDPDIDGDGIANEDDNCKLQYGCNPNGCPADCNQSTVTVNCNNAAFNGNYVVGTALSGTTFTITMSNSSFSSATVAFAAGDLVLDDPALTVGTPTPTSSTVASGGSVTISYPISGTPSACGKLTGVWTKLSLTCTKTVDVGAGGNFILPATAITYSTIGEVSGFTANWTALSGVTQYTVERSTSATGPWTAFPSSPYSGTSAAVSGLSGSAAYWIKITAVDGTCPGSFNISNGPAGGCAAKVDAVTWKIFLCHNLGANPTLDPHTPVVGIHGAYVQWGRRGPNTTGDSRIDWQTASNTSTFAAAPTASNANAGIISGWNITSAATTNWSDATKTVNDPCPTGYKVPTIIQWAGVVANNTLSRTGTWANSTTNYGTAAHFGPSASTKTLTLPTTGYRFNSNGNQEERGFRCGYHSTTSSSTIEAKRIHVSSTGVNATTIYSKTGGYSVRCIKQ